MKRAVAALLAASLTAPFCLPAVCVAAQAAGPFEVVPPEAPARGPHRLAWASFLAGAGLVGASLVLTDRANRAYDDYLVATDPAELGRLYDRARRYDRLSAAALLTGEARVATAVWLRFIRRSPGSRLTLLAEPDRCAVSLRF